MKSVSVSFLNISRMLTSNLLVAVGILAAASGAILPRPGKEIQNVAGFISTQPINPDHMIHTPVQQITSGRLLPRTVREVTTPINIEHNYETPEITTSTIIHPEGHDWKRSLTETVTDSTSIPHEETAGEIFEHGVERIIREEKGVDGESEAELEGQVTPQANSIWSIVPALAYYALPSLIPSLQLPNTLPTLPAGWPFPPSSSKYMVTPNLEPSSAVISRKIKIIPAPISPSYMRSYSYRYPYYRYPSLPYDFPFEK